MTSQAAARSLQRYRKARSLATASASYTITRDMTRPHAESQAKQAGIMRHLPLDQRRLLAQQRVLLPVPEAVPKRRSHPYLDSHPARPRNPNTNLGEELPGARSRKTGYSGSAPSAALKQNCPIGDPKFISNLAEVKPSALIHQAIHAK